MSIAPSTAAARVTAGADWAKDDHAVCVVGDQGGALERFTVRHDAAGLRQMAARLLHAGALQTGIERTDARRLRPMERDSEQATALRSTVRARRDLAGHRVAAASQLRARLQIVFLAAATLFAGIDPAITLAFLSRFTTQEQADWLSPLRLAAWLKSVAYSGKTDPAVLHARLLAAPRGHAGQ